MTTTWAVFTMSGNAYFRDADGLTEEAAKELAEQMGWRSHAAPSDSSPGDGQ